MVGMDGAKAKAMFPDDSGFPKPFGKYELLEQIGVGGMAEIFKARFTGIEGFEKLVVVKRILPNFASNRSFIRMLINEAKIAAALQHPNVVEIYDLGQIDKQHYIAMEFVNGRDLLKVLSRCVKRRKRIPLKLTLYVIAEICKGLAYAHSGTDPRGQPLHIVHRDVSPSNIIISYAGEVKITDFGVARARTQQSNTKAGVLKGKLGYMSPEQVMGKEVDYRSDIFALGTVLFETITLKRLFLGNADLQTLVNIRDVRIDHRLARHKYIPEPIVDVLRVALARDPAERYPSAMELHDAIVDFMYDKRLRVRPSDLARFLEALYAEDDETLEMAAPPEPEDVALAEGAAAADALSSSDEDSGAFEDDEDDEDDETASEEAPPPEPAVADEAADAPASEPGGDDVESGWRAAAAASGGLLELAEEPASPEETDEAPKPQPMKGRRNRQNKRRNPSSSAAIDVALDGADAALADLAAAGTSPGRERPSGVVSRQTGPTAEPSQPIGYESSRLRSTPGPAETPFGADARTPSAERSGLRFDIAEASDGSDELPHAVSVRLGNSAFRLRDSLGNVFGPVSFQNFVNLIRARAVTESELVSVDGGEWRAARSVPGIREIKRTLFRPEADQASFSGEVRHVEIPRLLYRIWAEKLSGKLKFRFQTTRKEIYFVDGKPRHIASSLKGELLGAHLVARKLVTPAQVQTAIQRMATTREKIGDAIVSLGYLRHHELYEAFQQLHRRKFLQVFVWNTGRFEFFRRGRPPSGVILLELDVPAVIAEGVREFFGFTELKRFFKPNYHHRIVTGGGKRPKVTVGDLRLNAQESRFSRYAHDGGVLVEILREHARVNRDALTLFRVLFLLQQMELVRFEAP